MSKPLSRIEVVCEAARIEQMNTVREERARLKRYLADGKMSLTSIEAEVSPGCCC